MATTNREIVKQTVEGWIERALDESLRSDRATLGSDSLVDHILAALDAKAAVPGGDAAQLQDNLDWVEQKILTVYKSPGTKDEQLQRIQGSMHVICAGYDSWKRWVKESDNDVVSLKRRIVELEQRLAPTPSPDAAARARAILENEVTRQAEFGMYPSLEDFAVAIAAALTASEAEVIERARRDGLKEGMLAAASIASERANEYAVRADTAIAAGNQSNGDAWANWMKGAERTRQAITAALQSLKGGKDK